MYPLYILCCTLRKRLTGHSNMAVRFALVDHIHNLIGAGDKTLSASLRGGEETRGQETGGEETRGEYMIGNKRREVEKTKQRETKYETDLISCI